MGAAFRMKQIIEQRYGEPQEVVLPRLIQKLHTPNAVAQHLGVYPTAVTNWLRNNGWKCVITRRWIKEEEQEIEEIGHG